LEESREVQKKLRQKTESYIQNQKEDIKKANDIVSKKEIVVQQLMADISIKRDKIESYKERL
jgi:uncharacterized FlgJ-related protein